MHCIIYLCNKKWIASNKDWQIDQMWIKIQHLNWKCAVILGKLWSVFGETQMVSSKIVPVKKSQAINTYRCMNLKE